MRSAARLTYREVGEFLERPGATHAPRLEALRERLIALHGIYKSFTRESHYKVELTAYPGYSITQLNRSETPEYLLYVRYTPGGKK